MLSMHPSIGLLWIPSHLHLHLPTSFVQSSFGMMVPVFGLFLSLRFVPCQSSKKGRDVTQRIDEKRRRRIGVPIPDSVLRSEA